MACTRGLLKFPFNHCESLLTFHSSCPTGADSLRLFGLLRSYFGKDLIENGKLSGANELQPGGSQGARVLRLISRLGQLDRRANSWGAINKLLADLEGDKTAARFALGGQPPTPRRGGRVYPSLCPIPGRIPAPTASRRDGGPGGPGVSHLPRVVVLTPHVYSLVHVAV